MNNPVFSIVIPYHTHEKTVDFLKRQLTYYHSSPIPMFVIIAVSGDVAIKQELTQFLEKLNNPHFIFFSTDEQNITNVRPFIKKIFDALKLVTTPYVVINGADDVLIPQAIETGLEILGKNLDISAVKGRTVYFDCHSGKIFFSKDLPMLNDSSLQRLKLAIKDRDSIFYIIRRTEDLVREYKNIVDLSMKSEAVGNSLYHIEHFKALSVASLGKIFVFDSLWRVQTSHKNNHTSHTPASFIRIKLGVLDKKNYEWFKSVTKNMQDLGYNYYKFLWVCHQIRGICVTFKQIAYQLIYKKCGLIDSVRICMYLILNKAYVFSQKFLPEKLFGEKVAHYGSAKDFTKTKEFSLLKKYYFSEDDIKLIESRNISE